MIIDTPHYADAAASYAAISRYCASCRYATPPPALMLLPFDTPPDTLIAP